jgi:hypothetical protein
VNYQYPLETLARKAVAGSQLDFAREARRIFDDSDEALFEAHDHGLAIFAAHEEALARPVQVLQELYGEDVEVRRPKVRYLPGEPPHEPIMRARIAAPLEFADGVVRELKRRGARIVETCLRARTAVVRAEAPLAVLIGLPALLDVMTRGNAISTIRLLRYAPLPVHIDPASA